MKFKVRMFTTEAQRGRLQRKTVVTNFSVPLCLRGESYGLLDRWV